MRRLVYFVFILAVVVGGYWLAAGVVLKSRQIQRVRIPLTVVAERQTPRPWYVTQSSPPALITAPDEPVFPDPADEPTAQPLRAYEEALPRDVYETPAKSPPPAKPASAPPASMGVTPAATLSAPALAVPSELPPWRRYALASPPPDDHPMIALVIDDLGIDKKRSARAIALKGPLTLSFLAYASDIKRQTAAARAAGHELLLHISMEPASKHVDPGPHVLKTALSAAELRRRLEWGFSRLDAFVGINNHMGSKFTADSAGMKVVMEELRRRGLLFLDSRTSRTSVGAKMARRMGVPYAERNIFLDHVNDVVVVESRLAETERLARRKGYAVAISHPRDSTFKALVPWLRGIEAKGFRLVPLSAVVRGVITSG
ncbi:MAG TPA: divergent polysaccharide deacetylase family protein [Rhodospirillales bacterium]|jgi:hypothetical protein|nr:divergent polysaccharide deacetylase family protein [Rhodospirillales bacterium]